MWCDGLPHLISTVGSGKFSLPPKMRTVTFKKEIAGSFTRGNSRGRERRHKQWNFINGLPLEQRYARVACFKFLGLSSRRKSF